MTPDAGTTTTLTPPHTDPSSTSDCGKLKLVSGFHLLMIYFKPTSSSTSNPRPKHPPGKPNVPGQPTSLSLAAGVSPFVPSKKTTARLHHKTPLTKLPSNSFVLRFLPKSRPSQPPPLPRPNAPATNTLPKRSHTELSRTAYGNLDSHLTPGAPRLATRTLPPYLRPPTALKLLDYGCLPGPKAVFLNTLPISGLSDESNPSARNLGPVFDPSPYLRCFLNLPQVSFWMSPKPMSYKLLAHINTGHSWNAEQIAWSTTFDP